ncbi:MAG: aspartate--tRNA ligase [bacterium]|nr:aspartate--tRNA ligase [bacterium]
MKRTHNCGELGLKDIGKEVILAGWVNRRRDHGKLIFIDLRDREGITQVVFSPEADDISHAKAHEIRSEYVIEIKGQVCNRPVGTINPDINTGEIEVLVHELTIINPSKTPPFSISDDLNVSEDARLRYRYLDLRRPQMQKNLFLRHRVYQTVRRFLDEKGYIEVETPMLIKSTPEGARDFLVPSRLSPREFYALPQSPQLFKQILMVAGFEKYFQIVKCFRDEDLRADRQPEFTQVDIEASFVSIDDICGLIEGLLSSIFKNSLGIEIKTPFPRMDFDEAMDRYGSDAPDTRFGMELIEITDLVRDEECQVFNRVIAQAGQVKGICVPNIASMSRKDIDELTAFVNIYGAKGLAYFKGKESPIAKFLSEKARDEILSRMGADENSLCLFVADTPKIVAMSLCQLRLHLARKINMIPENTFNLLWVLNAPLLEYDDEEKRFTAMHHPFTSPRETDYPLLDTDPLKVKANAYDVVLNGVEIGGGSIRIHSRAIQERVFNLLSLSKEEAREKFGFLLEALEYGAPPHGGVALGLDRLLRFMVGAESIRDVIAFPKTQSGICQMTGAPYRVDNKQLKELKIRLIEEE